MNVLWRVVQLGDPCHHGTLLGNMRFGDVTMFTQPWYIFLQNWQNIVQYILWRSWPKWPLTMPMIPSHALMSYTMIFYQCKLKDRWSNSNIYPGNIYYL